MGLGLAMQRKEKQSKKHKFKHGPEYAELMSTRYAEKVKPNHKYDKKERKKNRIDDYETFDEEMLDE